MRATKTLTLLRVRLGKLNQKTTLMMTKRMKNEVESNQSV
jgi:hypothetical protein